MVHASSRAALRFLVDVAALLAADAFFSRSPVVATNFTGEGTIVDDVSGQRGTWRAEFVSTLTDVHGVLTLSGSTGTVTAEMAGSVTPPNRIEFAWPTDAPEQSVFTGTIEGTLLHGLSKNPKGQTSKWDGAWEVLSGYRPREVGPEAFQQDEEDYDRILKQPIPEPPRDPNDAFASCQLLQDKRAMALISEGGEFGLRRHCERSQDPAVIAARTGTKNLPASAASANLALLLHQGSSWFLRFRSLLRDAFAQSPPVNVLVNNRASDTYPNILQQEESIAVSLLDHQHMVAGFNDDGNLTYPCSISGVGYTANTGSTWQDRGAISCPIVNGYPGLNDSVNPLPLPQLLPAIDCLVTACAFGDYLGLAAVNPAANNFYAVAFHDTRMTASGTHCDGSIHPDTSPDPDIRAAVGF